MYNCGKNFNRWEWWLSLQFYRLLNLSAKFQQRAKDFAKILEWYKRWGASSVGHQGVDRRIQDFDHFETVMPQFDLCSCIRGRPGDSIDDHKLEGQGNGLELMTCSWRGTEKTVGKERDATHEFTSSAQWPFRIEIHRNVSCSPIEIFTFLRWEEAYCPLERRQSKLVARAW